MYSPCCTPSWNPQCCPPTYPPVAQPPWWWWYQQCPPGSRPAVNVNFSINWTTPTNIAINAVIPAGLWVYVGPTAGPVNVAAAHASGTVTTAAFIFSDGTMTATTAGIIYPVTAATASS